MTTTTFSMCPETENLCFAFGDTEIWTRTMKDSAGNVIDITGRTYRLTVSTDPNPVGTAGMIFSIEATIPTGTDGVTQWQFSDADWLAWVAVAGQPPGTAFYDLQQITATGRRSLRKGDFQVVMDITKPDRLIHVAAIGAGTGVATTVVT